MGEIGVKNNELSDTWTSSNFSSISLNSEAEIVGFLSYANTRFGFGGGVGSRSISTLFFFSKLRPWKFCWVTSKWKSLWLIFYLSFCFSIIFPNESGSEVAIRIINFVFLFLRLFRFLFQSLQGEQIFTSRIDFVYCGGIVFLKEKFCIRSLSKYTQ